MQMNKYLFFANDNKLIVCFDKSSLICITPVVKIISHQDLLQNSTDKSHQKVFDFLTAFFSQNFELAEKIRQKINFDTQGTKFQKEVWNEIGKIKPGKTLSYKEIATLIKRPLAYRAVGSACSKNPLPFFIPCHRVIAQNNKLGGYSGGLLKKIELLRNENIRLLPK